MLDIYSRIIIKIRVFSKLINLYKNLLNNIINELSFISALKEVIKFDNNELFKKLDIYFIKDNKKNTRAIKRYLIREISIDKKIDLTDNN